MARRREDLNALHVRTQTYHVASRTAVIAVGSNLGDRRAAIAFAVDQLSHLIPDLTLSDIVETEPEGDGLCDQPFYLHAVMVGAKEVPAADMVDGLRLHGGA